MKLPHTSYYWISSRSGFQDRENLLTLETDMEVRGNRVVTLNNVDYSVIVYPEDVGGEEPLTDEAYVYPRMWHRSRALGDTAWSSGQSCWYWTTDNQGVQILRPLWMIPGFNVTYLSPGGKNVFLSFWATVSTQKLVSNLHETIMTPTEVLIDGTTYYTYLPEYLGNGDQIPANTRRALCTARGVLERVVVTLTVQDAEQDPTFEERLIFDKPTGVLVEESLLSVTGTYGTIKAGASTSESDPARPVVIKSRDCENIYTVRELIIRTGTDTLEVGPIWDNVPCIGVQTDDTGGQDPPMPDPGDPPDADCLVAFNTGMEDGGGITYVSDMPPGSAQSHAEVVSPRTDNPAWTDAVQGFEDADVAFEKITEGTWTAEEVVNGKGSVVIYGPVSGVDYNVNPEDWPGPVAIFNQYDFDPRCISHYLIGYFFSRSREYRNAFVAELRVKIDAYEWPGGECSSAAISCFYDETEDCIRITDRARILAQLYRLYNLVAQDSDVVDLGSIPREVPPTDEERTAWNSGFGAGWEQGLSDASNGVDFDPTPEDNPYFGNLGQLYETAYSMGYSAGYNSYNAYILLAQTFDPGEITVMHFDARGHPYINKPYYDFSLIAGGPNAVVVGDDGETYLPPIQSNLSLIAALAATSGAFTLLGKVTGGTEAVAGSNVYPAGPADNPGLIEVELWAAMYHTNGGARQRILKPICDLPDDVEVALVGKIGAVQKDAWVPVFASNCPCTDDNNLPALWTTPEANISTASPKWVVSETAPAGWVGTWPPPGTSGVVSDAEHQHPLYLSRDSVTGVNISGLLFDSLGKLRVNVNTIPLIINGITGELEINFDLNPFNRPPLTFRTNMFVGDTEQAARSNRPPIASMPVWRGIGDPQGLDDGDFFIKIR